MRHHRKGDKGGFIAIGLGYPLQRPLFRSCLLSTTTRRMLRVVALLLLLPNLAWGCSVAGQALGPYFYTWPGPLSPQVIRTTTSHPDLLMGMLTLWGKELEEIPPSKPMFLNVTIDTATGVVTEGWPDDVVFTEPPSNTLEDPTGGYEMEVSVELNVTYVALTNSTTQIKFPLNVPPRYETLAKEEDFAGPYFFVPPDAMQLWVFYAARLQCIPAYNEPPCGIDCPDCVFTDSFVGVVDLPTSSVGYQAFPSRYGVALLDPGPFHSLRDVWDEIQVLNLGATDSCGGTGYLYYGGLDRGLPAIIEAQRFDPGVLTALSPNDQGLIAWTVSQTESFGGDTTPTRRVNEFVLRKFDMISGEPLVALPLNLDQVEDVISSSTGRGIDSSIGMVPPEEALTPSPSATSVATTTTLAPMLASLSPTAVPLPSVTSGLPPPIFSAPPTTTPTPLLNLTLPETVFSGASPRGDLPTVEPAVIPPPGAFTPVPMPTTILPVESIPPMGTFITLPPVLNPPVAFGPEPILTAQPIEAAPSEPPMQTFMTPSPVLNPPDLFEPMLIPAPVVVPTLPPLQTGNPTSAFFPLPPPKPTEPTPAPIMFDFPTVPLVWLPPVPPPSPVAIVAGTGVVPPAFNNLWQGPSTWDTQETTLARSSEDVREPAPPPFLWDIPASWTADDPAPVPRPPPVIVYNPSRVIVPRPTPAENLVEAFEASSLCSAVPACEGLLEPGSDCCPTVLGFHFACCGQQEQVACASNPMCETMGIMEGSCCPTPEGVYLDCCAVVPDACATDSCTVMPTDEYVRVQEAFGDSDFAESGIGRRSTLILLGPWLVFLVWVMQS